MTREELLNFLLQADKESLLNLILADYNKDDLLELAMSYYGLEKVLNKLSKIQRKEK